MNRSIFGQLVACHLFIGNCPNHNNKIIFFCHNMLYCIPNAFYTKELKKYLLIIELKLTRWINLSKNGVKGAFVCEI